MNRDENLKPLSFDVVALFIGAVALSISCGKKPGSTDKLTGASPTPSSTTTTPALCSAPLDSSERSGTSAMSRASSIESTIIEAAQSIGPSFHCGDILTQSTTLTADLDCRGVTGVALTFSGDGLTLDGGGHKILADQAAIGLLVKGSHQTVKSLVIDGVSNGTGLLAYAANYFTATGNQFTRNSIGLFAFAEHTDLIGLNIQNNQLSCNTLTGLRTLGATGVTVRNPRIQNNSATKTSGYGFMLHGDQIVVSGSDGNHFDQSLGALFVGGGSIRVNGLDLADQNIQTNPVMAAIAQSVRVENSNFSNSLTGGDKIGIQFYDVASSEAYGNTFQGFTIGIQLAVDSSVSSAVPTPSSFASSTLERNTFRASKLSGVFIKSQDGTPFGVLTVDQNDYARNSPGRANLVLPGTTIGAGSHLDPIP